jgi:DNA-binding NarL/FixJ family response regulator
MSAKIAIADDSAGIRSALRTVIESNTEWQVCGEAENGQDAVLLVQRQKPDVLVLDLSMPVMNGLEAARKIATISPKTKIVFTWHASREVLRDAKIAGIRAVLSKGEGGMLESLVTTLHEASDRREAA